MIIFPEKTRIITQHRFDARFFVISRNKEQQAWLRHADSVTENFRAGNLEKRVKEIYTLFSDLAPTEHASNPNQHPSDIRNSLH